MRDFFQLPPDQIYLCGNSLGPLPRETSGRLANLIEAQWGRDLVRCWNRHGWMELPLRTGDKIARLIGAGPGEVVVADSTSVNLYKVLCAALSHQARVAPQRSIVLTEDENFPSDLYIAAELCRERGFELAAVKEEAALSAAIDERVAVLLLTEVNYRSALRHDMKNLTRLAREAGALTVWDLSHSAGAMPLDLTEAGPDFAVGCGYKYLCGGPGAPGYLWVNPGLAGACVQPLTGWMGHDRPFDFKQQYEPAPGIGRFLCGTPPILSLAALECGLDLFLAAEPLGGMGAVRHKSLGLSRLFMETVKAWGIESGLRVVSPAEPARRGSHVALSLEGELSGAGYAVMQALIARGVIGDFRAGEPGNAARPDLLRFGLTPLTLGFAELARALGHLRDILDRREWRQERFTKREKVT
jgi:kynureninase